VVHTSLNVCHIHVMPLISILSVESALCTVPVTENNYCDVAGEKVQCF